MFVSATSISSLISARPAAPKARADDAGGRLSADQQREVDELRATDRKVRAHEQAHIAVGGELIRGAAAYSYQTGPDNQRYAVAGEVSIDTSKARTPQETIPKAEHIQDAALAPADPSPQDLQVASYASRMEMEARQEVAQQAAQERGLAGGGRAGRAIAAYQSASGARASTGFSVQA